MNSNSRKKIVQAKISIFVKPTNELEKMKMLFTLEVSGCVFCVKGSYVIIHNKFSKHFDYNSFKLKSLFLYFLGASISSPYVKKRVGRPTKQYTF